MLLKKLFITAILSLFIVINCPEAFSQFVVVKEKGEQPSDDSGRSWEDAWRELHGISEPDKEPKEKGEQPSDDSGRSWEDPWRELHGISKSNKKTKKNEIKGLILQGNQYFKDKNYSDAMDVYTKVIKLDPKRASAYLMRGGCYYELKNYPQAMNDFNKAIKLDPKYASAYGYRGDCYNMLKNYPQAINDYDKVLKLDPKRASAYLMRGGCYYELKNYPQAMNDFNKAIKLDPKRASAYGYRGDCYNMLKNYPQAINDYDKVIGLDPNNAYAYYGKACAYSLMDNQTEACEYLKIAVDKGFNNWDHIKSDRDLDNIRNSPCYKEIIKDPTEPPPIGPPPEEDKPRPPEITSTDITKLSELSVGYLKKPIFIEYESVNRRIGTDEALLYDPKTGKIEHPYKGKEVDLDLFVEGKNANIQGTIKEKEDNILVNITFIVDFSFSRILLEKAELPLTSLNFKQYILQPHPRKEYMLECMVKKSNKPLRLDIITQQNRTISFMLTSENEQIKAVPIQRPPIDNLLKGGTN